MSIKNDEIQCPCTIKDESKKEDLYFLLPHFSIQSNIL